MKLYNARLGFLVHLSYWCRTIFVASNLVVLVVYYMLMSYNMWSIYVLHDKYKHTSVLNMMVYLNRTTNFKTQNTRSPCMSLHKIFRSESEFRIRLSAAYQGQGHLNIKMWKFCKNFEKNLCLYFWFCWIRG